MNSVIFLSIPKAQKALMLVDVVFPGWVPFSQLAASSNIPGWIAAHKNKFLNMTLSTTSEVI
jgi:hypothetical protein